MSRGAGCQKQGRLVNPGATAGQLLPGSSRVMLPALGAHGTSRAASIRLVDIATQQGKNPSSRSVKSCSRKLIICRALCTAGLHVSCSITECPIPNAQTQEHGKLCSERGSPVRDDSSMKPNARQLH